MRDIPVKPPLLATIKSNNYLINALTCEEAEDHVRMWITFWSQTCWRVLLHNDHRPSLRPSINNKLNPPAQTYLHAELQGGFLGIQLDPQGRVAEGSIGNVAVLNAKVGIDELRWK